MWFLPLNRLPVIRIIKVLALAPQPEPANRLIRATRDINFVRSETGRWRYVNDLRI